MSDYKNDGTEVHRTKSRSGGIIALLLVIVALVIGLLFATGFWSADVTKSGALPTVSVDGGALPKVDLQSKEIVVGTTATKVEVPTVKTETTTIDVPTVGIKDDKK
jgi:hypothetical protein